MKACNTIYEWLDIRNIKYNSNEIINQSLVHSSYVNEHRSIYGDNERLELLGDAVLQFWSAQKLFKLEPELSEGQMTTLRAQLVCEESLAEFCRINGWNQYLLLGIGEEKTGGRNRDSILADMFEAVLGAIYLECGLDAVDTILNEVITPAINQPKSENLIDYKTKLQEFIQSDTRKTVHYEVINVKGPSNKPEFEVSVYLDTITLGTGSGYSKKRAEQMAAKEAFEKMVK